MATRIGLPVSTTHSIMGGIIGMGFATVGGHNISWGWKGVAQVFAAWGIAPGLAGAFGAIVFLITKFGVMRRKDPVRNAFFTVPAYFLVTASLIAMLIVWKGASKSIKLDDGGIAGVIVGVGVGVALLSVLFLLPYIHRKLIKGDWQIKPWEAIYGPLLLRRGEVPPAPEGMENAGVQNYYRGHLTREELDAKRAADAARAEATGDVEKGTNVPVAKSIDSESDVATVNRHGNFKDLAEDVSPRPEGSMMQPAVLWWYAKRWFFHGLEKDVVSLQSKRSILSASIEEAHARSEHYDNRAEYCYSFLQIMTATAASFTHGANDVANAIGPYATVYLIWNSGEQKSEVPVPIWILAFGGAGIVIGLWTYGYNIMRNLGNRLTLMSPSRGFSMELGSTITIILATRLKLPVSTTQCITGATVGVGLCNGDWRTINWRMVCIPRSSMFERR